MSSDGRMVRYTTLQFIVTQNTLHLLGHHTNNAAAFHVESLLSPRRENATLMVS